MAHPAQKRTSPWLGAITAAAFALQIVALSQPLWREPPADEVAAAAVEDPAPAVADEEDAPDPKPTAVASLFDEVKQVIGLLALPFAQS